MISGQAFKQARYIRDLTQRQAAALIGVSERTIGNWERGQSIPQKYWDVIREELDVPHEPGTDPSQLASQQMLQQLRNDRPSFEFRDQLRGVPDVALLDELLWRALRVRAADVGGGPEGENVHFLHSRDASPEIPSSGIAAMKGEKTMDEPWAE